MSEDAILRRLKTVEELRTLCLSLMKAKKESDEKKKKEEKSNDEKILKNQNAENLDES